jgi:hypothetical protein
MGLTLALATPAKAQAQQDGEAVAAMSLLESLLEIAQDSESSNSRSDRLTPSGWETRVFELEHADPDTMQDILRMFRSESNVVGELRVLSVTAPPEIMPAIVETVERFDVPVVRRSVELTVYVLNATDDGADHVPPALDEVVGELRQVLSYSSFRILDTLVIRAVDGTPVASEGQLPIIADNPRPAPYSFRGFVRVRTSGDGESVMSLENLDFTTSIVGTAASIRTEVDVPVGQQVVVGKATINEGAIVLVLNARFLE